MKKLKFKKGDNVKCIDSSNSDRLLKKDKIYKVISFTYSMARVDCEVPGFRWFKERFVKVPKTEKKPSKPKIKLPKMPKYNVDDVVLCYVNDEFIKDTFYILKIMTISNYGGLWRYWSGSKDFTGKDIIKKL